MPSRATVQEFSDSYPFCHNGFRPIMMPKIVSVQHSTRRHLTSFVGRKAELNDVRRLLSDKRLVTLTGPDGMGKSRLALQIGAQIAHEFTYGRWDCDLATVTDRDCVSISMLNALGLPVQPGLSAIDTLVGVINDARVLLVLDHCEHLLDACAAIIDSLLRSCPRLTILTTSTEAIGLAGELTWRVPPLSLTNDAIELFVDRARRVRSDFAINADTAVTVGEICRRLDGVPLAIELAAARTDTLSPVEILAGLNDRFRLVAGAAGNAVRPEQTLCATVQWSHALLSGPERALLHRLAVSPAGSTLTAPRRSVPMTRTSRATRHSAGLPSWWTRHLSSSKTTGAERDTGCCIRCVSTRWRSSVSRERPTPCLRVTASTSNNPTR